jgi:predicted subunit of tRNA(5-methylaminomethyl-2-thiouridylate) methyltransferase
MAERCEVDPADPRICDACAAYVIAQELEDAERDKAASPVLSAERMRQLADRLDVEYRHLEAHPGTIMRGSRHITTDELRDVRERFKVIHATHTLILLASYASELRYWADQADNATHNTD